MSYAGSKRILDADSHLMEWPSFLSEHASASIAARVQLIIPPNLGYGGSRVGSIPANSILVFLVTLNATN